MDIPIPFISYYACILARLSYFDNDVFLQKYMRIFDLPGMAKERDKIKETKNMTDIFKGGDASKRMSQQFASINRICLEREKSVSLLLSSENVKYISISNSNYSSVYVVADKISNTICVAFRGTYSLKSMTSYTKLTSIIPFKICRNTDDGFMLGIFKIVAEIFYTMIESIDYLHKTFLKKKDYKLITTGHSLGGACALLFSFLWDKYDSSNKIVCITFGSPRVMNIDSIGQIRDFIQKKHLFYRSYVNHGDPFPMLPLIVRKTKNSFHHLEEYDENMIDTSYSCRTGKTKKMRVKCTFKNKTRKAKRRFDIKQHGNYLGISYKNAAQDLKNFRKEIKRNNEGDTICRIIVGGNNEKYRVSFFNLNNAKYKKKSYFTRKLLKISKKIMIDYKHQDIYINKDTFMKIIENGDEISSDSDSKELRNPLEFDKLVSINHVKKRRNLFICNV
jgi:predicted lipase